MDELIRLMGGIENMASFFKNIYIFVFEFLVYLVLINFSIYIWKELN